MAGAPRTLSYEDAYGVTEQPKETRAPRTLSYEDAYGVEPASRSFGDVAGDVGSQLGKGVNTIAGAIPNLLDPSSPVSKFFNDNAQYWQNDQSQITKSLEAAADARIAEAAKTGQWEAFKTAVKEYGAEPALVQKLILENIPSMIPGLAAAKGAQIAAKGSVIAGTVAGAGTNSLLNAGGARQESYQDIKSTLIAQGVPEAEADAQALEKSKVAAGVGAITGALSGGSGLERGILGGAKGGFAKRAGVELGGEQLEEVAPTIATNMQLDRDMLTGVGETSAKTLIASSPGSVISGFQGNSQPVQPTPPGAAQPDIASSSNVDELISATKSSIDVELDNQTNQDLLDEISASNNATSSNAPVDQSYVPQPDTEPRPPINIAPDVQPLVDNAESLASGQAQPIIEQSQPIDLSPQIAVEPAQQAVPQPTEGQNVQDIIPETQSQPIELAPETGGAVGVVQEQVTAQEVAAVQDIPTTEKMSKAISLVGDEEFKSQVIAKMAKYRPTNEDQKAMLVEATAIEILAKGNRSLPTVNSDFTPTTSSTLSSRSTTTPASTAQAVPTTDSALSEALKPLRTEILKFKGEGKTVTGTKTIYDATDRLKAIAEDTGETSLKAQQVWFNSKRKTLEKNGDIEAAALFERIVAQLKERINTAQEPAPVKIDEQVATVASDVAEKTANVVAPKPKRKVGIPKRMSLLEWVASEGGFNRAEVAAEIGRIDDLKAHKSGIFGSPSFRVKGGQSWDKIGERLAEAGYLPKNEYGQYDKHDLFERIDAELDGEKQYTVDDIEGIAETDKAARELDELRGEAESVGVDWKKYKTIDDLWVAIDAKRFELSDADEALLEDVVADDSADTDFDFGTPVSAAETEAWLNGVEDGQGNQGQANGATAGAQGEGDQRSTERSSAQGEAEQQTPDREFTLTSQTEEDLRQQEARAADTSIADREAADRTSEVPLTLSAQSSSNTSSAANQGSMFTPDGRASKAADQTASKEPWQMTQAEYTASRIKNMPAAYQDRYSGEDWRKERRAEVKQAIVAGKPVPAEVLADYPDLKPAKEPKPTDPISQMAASVESLAKSVQALVETQRKPDSGIEISTASIDTLNSWKNYPGVIKSVKGWSLFKDPVYEKFVLMRKAKEANKSGGGYVSAERAGYFDTENQASEWAALNSGQNKTDDVSKKAENVDTSKERVKGIDISAEGVQDEPAADKGTALFSKSTPTQNTHTVASATSSMLEAHTGKIKAVLQAMLDNGKAKVVTAEQAAGIVGEDALYMTAWHGSPHDHDGFSMDKVGTGEGAQAFGHGLYFAGRKEVAEYYRDTLSGKTSTRSDNDYPPISNRDWARDIALDLPDYGKRNMVDRINLGKYDEAFASNTEKQATIAWINGDDKTGRLYQVELAPSEDEYLLWDKPLSEQSEKVKAVLRLSFKDELKEYYALRKQKYPNGYKSNPDFTKEQDVRLEYLRKNYYEAVNDINGRMFYANTSKEKGSDKAASDYLHSLGIRGIKYLDGSSRGYTANYKKQTPKYQEKVDRLQAAYDANKTQENEYKLSDAKQELQSAIRADKENEGEFNYVIFNDKDVKITAKFAKEGQALAFYNPHDGITYFVADHIPEGYTAKEWEGLILHEISVHALSLGRDTKEFKSILNQIDLMRKAGNKAVVAAFKRVPKDTRPENVTEEAIAYLLQESPQLSIVQRVLSWFRNAIRAIGKSFPTLQKMKLHDWASKLNESDLRFMAESALKNAEPSGVQNESYTPQFSKPDSSILFSKNTNSITHPFQPENSGKPLDSWIKIFTRNQIVTLYRDSLIGKKLEEYKELRERVMADTNSLFEKADNFLLELRQIPKGLRDAFASLAHDSTLNNIDPSNPKYVPSPDAVKLADYLAGNPTNKMLAAKIKKRLDNMEAVHKKLHAEFNALPTKEQELFKELRSKYTEQMTMVFDEFKNRIGRMKNIDPAIKASSVKKLDEQLTDLLGRVYFPLYRAGNYIVKAEKAGEPTTVDHVESNFAADRLEKKLKKLGYTVSRSTRIVSPQDNKSGEALNAVRDLLDKAALKGKIEGAELSQLMDDIDQTILQSLPDQSYRKSFIHRKGTKGYSDDFIRAYADAMRRGSINIANLRHGDKITTVIEDMRKDVKDASKVPGSNVAALNQVVDRVEQIEVDIRNPTSKLVSVSGKIAFAQMLGSLSNFILNITQTPLLTMPHLGAEYGYGKANLQLAMAYAKQMRSLKKQGTLSELGKWLDMRHGLIGNELDLMQQLHDSGFLDLTQSFDLIDAANNPSYQENELSMNVMKVIALPQHVSEIVNRQVTALATIRLEMARSGSPLKAYHAARKAIDQTHFNYSKENRAKLMTGNTQSILFRFKQYAQQAAFLFVHTAKLALDGSANLDSDGNKLDGTRPSERTKARKQLAGVLGMQILVAGTLGLPIFAEAAVAASGVAGFKLAGSTGAYVGVAGAIILAAALAFGDDDGEEFDVEVKKWFIKNFGYGIGSSLASGVIPRGLSTRLDASELIIRRPEEKRTPTDTINAWMLSLLGPILGGIVYNAGIGVKEIAEGDIAKGATKLIPVKAIKDLVTSWQWANDGMNVTNKDGEIITPVSKADIFFKSIGINPTSVVNARELDNAKFTLHNALLKKQQKALKELREETDKTKRFNAIIKYNKSAPLGYEIDSDKVRGVIAREIKYKGKPNVVTGNPVQEGHLNEKTKELRPAY